MSSTELALIESPTLRAAYVTRTEVLDRVQGFTLPEGREWLTADELAHGVDGQSGFGVDVRTIRKLTERNRVELESNGLTKLTYDQQTRHLVASELQPAGRLVYPRRAVLNVAMLLRDSEVARMIRTYLLDAEERSIAPVAMPETRSVRRRMPKRLATALAEDRLKSVEFDPVSGRYSAEFRPSYLQMIVNTSQGKSAQVRIFVDRIVWAAC